MSDRRSSEVDVVEHCDLAGVQLTWLRERASDAGHYVTLVPTDDPAESTTRGPLGRGEAMLVFEAMRAALLAAARQQNVRLRKIMLRAG